MSGNPKLRKNGGKGTFFGNLWRSVVSKNIPLGDTLVKAIDGGNVTEIVKEITNDNKMTPEQKEIVVAELLAALFGINVTMKESLKNRFGNTLYIAIGVK